MALKNDGTRLLDWNGNVLESSIVSFAKAEKRLAAKKEALEDMQNEYELLENQAFSLYKEHVNYSKFEPSFIEQAKDWIAMQESGKDRKGNKLDGRKRYKEKDIAEYLFNNIKEYLGIDDFEPLLFMDYNFGQAVEIVFMSHKHKWYLEIPYIDNLNIEHYKRYGYDCFKLSLHHYNSEHSTCLIGSTFDEKELKDIMAKGIEKYCTKEKSDE